MSLYYTRAPHLERVREVAIFTHSDGRWHFYSRVPASAVLNFVSRMRVNNDLIKVAIDEANSPWMMWGPLMSLEDFNSWMAA